MTGSDQVIDDAFHTAYRILRGRIEAFLALPLSRIGRDRGWLQAELDRVGADRPSPPRVAEAAEPRPGPGFP